MYLPTKVVNASHICFRLYLNPQPQYYKCDTIRTRQRRNKHITQAIFQKDKKLHQIIILFLRKIGMTKNCIIIVLILIIIHFTDIIYDFV